MTFAISSGVPQAGIPFAVSMMAGVALALSMVAVATVLFRGQFVGLVSTHPTLVEATTRTLEVVAGAVLVAIALNDIL